MEISKRTSTILNVPTSNSPKLDNKILRTYKPNNNRINTMYVGDLNPGIYVVKIKTDKAEWLTKIIKL